MCSAGQGKARSNINSQRAQREEEGGQLVLVGHGTQATGRRQLLDQRALVAQDKSRIAEQEAASKAYQLMLGSAK